MELLSPEILIAAAGLVASVATAKYGLSGHEKRIDKLEKHTEDMPKNYVPRTEVELALKSIGDVTRDTKALITALVYGGGDREVARRALEPK